MHNDAHSFLTQVTLAVDAIVSPAYAVGGCVRDTLLGRPVHDYDFTTPVPPDQVERAVREAGRHPYLAGKRFGTVGFKLPPDAMRALVGLPQDPAPDTPQPPALFVEVTTFRSEEYQPDSRKPLVSFGTSLVEDLSRRDFTINALAFDGREVHDPFDGEKDLKRKVVRAVGDPIARLSEDPLRTLRAARFAAQLGFSVDPELAAAMEKTRVRLATVSHERWLIEMDKLLAAPHADAGLELLRECGVLRLIIPEAASLALVCGSNAWEETLRRVQAAPQTPEARWAALLGCCGQAAGAQEPDEACEVSIEVAHRTGYGLRWSKARHQAVEQLIRERGADTAR